MTAEILKCHSIRAKIDEISLACGGGKTNVSRPSNMLMGRCVNLAQTQWFELAK